MCLFLLFYFSGLPLETWWPGLALTKYVVALIRSGRDKSSISLSKGRLVLVRLSQRWQVPLSKRWPRSCTVYQFNWSPLHLRVATSRLQFLVSQALSCMYRTILAYGIINTRQEPLPPRFFQRVRSVCLGVSEFAIASWLKCCPNIALRNHSIFARLPRLSAVGFLWLSLGD